MNIKLFILSLLITPHLLFSYKKTTIQEDPFPKSTSQASPAVKQSINDDYKELEMLNAEYRQNDDTYYKELARVSKMAYQSAAGYAILLTIEYVGKITNTQEYVGFIFTLGNMFFAINLWEAGRSIKKMITCSGKTREIENKIIVIHNQLLREKYKKNLQTNETLCINN